MTPEEIIEFYNFKTEKHLKQRRENLKRFEDKNIHMKTMKKPLINQNL